MLSVRNNQEMLLSLKLIVVTISPLHAHELIITGDDEEFWNISHLVKVVEWVNDSHGLSEGISIYVLNDTCIKIVFEGISEAVIGLPLGVDIFD
jgi:hypothetical protein